MTRRLFFTFCAAIYTSTAFSWTHGGGPSYLIVGSERLALENGDKLIL